jgi:hypothetical protein
MATVIGLNLCHAKLHDYREYCDLNISSGFAGGIGHLEQGEWEPHIAIDVARLDEPEVSTSSLRSASLRWLRDQEAPFARQRRRTLLVEYREQKQSNRQARIRSIFMAKIH